MRFKWVTAFKVLKTVQSVIEVFALVTLSHVIFMFELTLPMFPWHSCWLLPLHSSHYVLIDPGPFPPLCSVGEEFT